MLPTIDACCSACFREKGRSGRWLSGSRCSRAPSGITSWRAASSEHTCSVRVHDRLDNHFQRPSEDNCRRKWTAQPSPAVSTADCESSFASSFCMYPSAKQDLPLSCALTKHPDLHGHCCCWNRGVEQCGVRHMYTPSCLPTFAAPLMWTRGPPPAPPPPVSF
jgi:hypothetical protein